MKTINQLAEMIDNIMPLVLLVGLIVISIIIIFYFIYKITMTYRYKNETRYYFEVIPPASSAIQSQATTELFKVLHGIDRSRTLIQKIFRYRSRISLEIVGTKHDGIRYIIGSPKNIGSVVEQEFRSYINDAKTAPVDDPYIKISSNSNMQTMEYRLKRHFALPLTPKDRLDSHDPLAYLTGNMTGLKKNETIIYQIIIVPRVLSAAKIIASKIITNDDVLMHLMNNRHNIFRRMASSINSFLFSVTDSVGVLSSQVIHQPIGQNRPVDPMILHTKQTSMRLKPNRVLSSFEQEAVESIHAKVSEPIFQTSVRTLVISPSVNTVSERSKSLRTSITSFSTTQYQSIVSRINYMRHIQGSLRFMKQQCRLPNLFLRTSLILSTAEVGALFHFPYAGTNKTENIVKSLSRTLPAPLSLKNNPTLDVLIGENIHHGVITPIGLTAAERERHMYVIGGTGNGKTTMLQYMIIQDIKNGKGVAVIDPHGDMAQEILTHIPEDRIKDVVYFNPDDLAYPIGMNLLEIDSSLTGDDLLREKDLITESVISIFRKIFSDDDSGGHRIEYILRNTIQTALTVPDCTIFTIYGLLNDVKYRNSVIKLLENEDLKHFWRNELGKAGDMQKVKMVAGITAKVGRFLFSASAKRILEQPKSTIDFEDIINNSKILICNFSKGLIGEDTSELLGTAILAKLQLASLKRARIAQNERKPYYLYVDEFQNFATVSFVQMLSESRKYKLYLTMAEQSTSQQADRDMVNIILANAGTVVCFRTGNPADEQIMLPLFSPYIESSEIMSLPSFNFYMRLAAVHSQEPLSGSTVLLDNNCSKVIAKATIKHSRKMFAIQYKNPQDNETAVIAQPPSKVKVYRKTLPK